MKELNLVRAARSLGRSSGLTDTFDEVARWSAVDSVVRHSCQCVHRDGLRTRLTSKLS